MPAAPPPSTPLWAVYIPLAALTLAAIVGAVWALRVVGDLRGDADDAESVKPKDLISPLYEAFRSGQMSEEEYERIRASIEAAGGDVALIPPPPRPKPGRAQRSDDPAPMPGSEGRAES